MEQVNNILAAVSDLVWGWPMAMILLSAGLILTLRMVFIQIRGFAHGVGIATGKYDDPAHKGQLTHFQALSAALSATIGIGNIAGVAIALYWGGPGAIFWMWVTAFFGMAIKYTECMLAIKHRKVEPDGNIRGGPMYFIELGMHKHFRPLAYMFAFCTAVAAFGAGNMVQSNTMADTLVNAFRIGFKETGLNYIKSTAFHDAVDEYNTSLAHTRFAFEQREQLADRLATIEETLAADAPEVVQLQQEVTAAIENTDSLKSQTQVCKDYLQAMKLVAVTGADGQVTFYDADGLPAEAETDGHIWSAKIENKPVDATAVTLVDATPVGHWRWVIGILIASLAGAVIIGGIKRIGRVASVLVPFMSVVYVISALIIVFINSDQIIPAFQLIFHHAFNPTAVVGGSVSGATVWMTFTWGLRRGLFSNEAGQGSAAMAHSTAKVEEPVREGLVAMLGPFIDTLVICTMTALVIITTGVWDCGINGAPLTMHAFNHALPVYGLWMVVVGVMLFAFSTVVAWSYYGEKGIEYLGGKKAKLPYKWVYILFTLLGARFDLKAVWSYADTANGLMAVPNLIALVVLSGAVVAMTRKYMREKAEGLHRPFR